MLTTTNRSVPVVPAPPTVRRRVLLLAAPVIGENLLQTMIGIVDTLFVARLGVNALAGVGTSIQVMFLLISVLSAVVVGGSILVAHATGAGQFGDASRMARQVVVWGVLLAIPLSIVGWRFAGQFVALFGATPAVTVIATAYLQVVLGALVVLMLAFACSSVLRGAGDTRTPLLCTAIANVVNAVAAWAFIFGHLGFPAMGPTGSAWAATLGRSVSASLLLFLLFRGRMGIRLLGRHGWRPHLASARAILRLGLPAAMEQLLVSSAFTMLTVLITRLGTDALAAQRVVGNAMSVSQLPGFGFSIAATTLVGQSMGAGKPAEGRKAALEALRWAVVWMGTAGVLFVLGGQLIVRGFSNDPGVIALGSAALRSIALFQPTWAIGIVLSGALRGAGDTRFPLFANATSIWLSVLLAWIVVSGFGRGLPEAWLCFAAVAPLAAVAVGLRFYHSDWQHARRVTVPGMVIVDAG
ncbi:MAG: MATE family efflux transporter [Chloroflexota bacterium]